MIFRNERLSLEEAREIDLVNYLTTCEYEPAKTRNNDYWYLSPLRDERTPSFKVNGNLNRWYDHGLGKGGNITDFAILYHNCTVGEFLQKLTGSFSFHQRGTRGYEQQRKENTESRIKILIEKSL
jgi:DNA primase